MNIEFPDRHAIDPESFGMNFPALVDGVQITCTVSTEALQDINPSNRMDSSESQFSANRLTFQEIAEGKIRNGDISNNRVIISSADVA